MESTPTTATRTAWVHLEYECVARGVAEFGEGHWAKILAKFDIVFAANSRNNRDIAAAWMRIKDKDWVKKWFENDAAPAGRPDLGSPDPSYDDSGEVWKTESNCEDDFWTDVNEDSDPAFQATPALQATPAPRNPAPRKSSVTWGGGDAQFQQDFVDLVEKLGVGKWKAIGMQLGMHITDPNGYNKKLKDKWRTICDTKVPSALRDRAREIHQQYLDKRTSDRWTARIAAECQPPPPAGHLKRAHDASGMNAAPVKIAKCSSSSRFQGVRRVGGPRDGYFWQSGLISTNPHTGVEVKYLSDRYNYDEEGERSAAEWYDEQCALQNRPRANFPRDGDRAMVTEFGTVPVPPNKSAFHMQADERLIQQQARSSGGEGVALNNDVM